MVVLRLGLQDYNINSSETVSSLS